MARYLLLESRDPFQTSDVEYFAEIAEGVSKRGNETILFLVQNGVLPARRKSKHSKWIKHLIKSGVRVFADEFSLRERAISKVVKGVEVSNIDQLTDWLLEPGTKAIWH